MGVSSSADSYRAEAERCRRLATTCRDPVAAERWKQIAKDYLELAESFDALHAAVHPQRFAQQQQNKDGDPSE
jgi:hypothetical protein